MSDEKIYKLYISKDEKNSGKRIDWKEIGLGVINGLAKADISDYDEVERTEENRNEKNSFWEEPEVEIKKKEKNDNNKYLKEQEKLEKQLKKEQLKQKVLMNKLQNKKESTISKIDVKNNNKYAFSSPKRTETKFEKMVRKGNENVIKMQNRADNIYGSDEEYRKKYPDSFKNKKHNYFETIRDENKSGSIENNIPDISNPEKLLFKNGLLGDIMHIKTDEPISIDNEEREKMINLTINCQKPINDDDYTRISSDYGYRIHPIHNKKIKHEGIDIAAPVNTKVYAIFDGFIEEALFAGANGNKVRINHGKNLDGKVVRSYYLHLNFFNVKKGDYVKKGQIIAGVGSTGVLKNGKPSSTGNHLHFSIKEDEIYVNPYKYIDLYKK